MINNFVNPFKQLYLWASQEALDLKALIESIELMEGLEEQRRKLMKKANITDESLKVLRPATSNNAKHMFDQSNQN